MIAWWAGDVAAARAGLEQAAGAALVTGRL